MISGKSLFSIWIGLNLDMLPDPFSCLRLFQVFSIIPYLSARLQRACLPAISFECGLVFGGRELKYENIPQIHSWTPEAGDPSSYIYISVFVVIEKNYFTQYQHCSPVQEYNLEQVIYEVLRQQSDNMHFQNL